MNWKLVSGVLAAALVFLLYRQRKATTSAANTNTNIAKSTNPDPVAAMLEAEGF
jgi:hypothetical protein